MATDLERLVVQLEATTNKFTREINKAHREANKQFSSIEKRASQMEHSVGASLSNLGRSMIGVGAAIAGSRGAQMVATAAQQYTSMQNALKATGLEGKALDTTFQSLFQIAQKNGTEMAPLVTLYGRMSTAQKELNASTGEMMRFTEGVSLALKVSGSSTQEASGALLQLSQAMGGGKIQAEEYNSLIDGARPLLQAVAAGMVEAGGSVSQLTALVKDGKVSSEAFFRAALAGMPTLEQAAGRMAGTVDQAMNQIKNAFTMLIGELDKTTGASSNAAANLQGVAAAIGQIPSYVDAAAGGLAKLQAYLNQVGNNPFWQKLGQLAGVDYSAEGMRKNGIIPMNGPMTNRVGDAWELSKTANGGSFTNYANTRMGPQIPAPKKISIKDYAVKDDKGGGKKAKGGGGGKSDEETRADQVARYIEQLEKQGRVLQAEFDTLGKSNAERAKAIELARIGTVTDQGQLASLNKQIDANEKLRSAIEDAKNSQKSLNETAEFAGNSIMDVFDDLIDGSGNLADSIKNIGKALASAALQAALMGSGPLGNLFGSGGKDGGTGGLIGSLLKGFTGSSGGVSSASATPGFLNGFATGGKVSGRGTGRSDSILAKLSNGEFVVNAKAAGQHGQLLQAINNGRLPGYANGGFVGAPSPASLRRGGATGANVIINNNTGQQVQQRQDANGNTHIDIGAAVDNALAERMGGSGRGSTAKLLQARMNRTNIRG